MPVLLQRRCALLLLLALLLLQLLLLLLVGEKQAEYAAALGAVPHQHTLHTQ
jgi:hypothetical protein